MYYTSNLNQLSLAVSPKLLFGDILNCAQNWIISREQKTGDVASSLVKYGLPGLGAAAVVVRVASTAVKISKVAKAGGSLAKFGQVGKVTSNLAGKLYVGRGAFAGPRGAMISSNGLNMYRPPTYKVNQGFKQSNFQARGSAQYKWSNSKRPGYYNGHLRIMPGVVPAPT